MIQGEKKNLESGGKKAKAKQKIQQNRQENSKNKTKRPDYWKKDFESLTPQFPPRETRQEFLTLAFDLAQLCWGHLGSISVDGRFLSIS